MQADKSGFSSCLAAVNHLDRLGFQSWCFPPGAGFLENEKWWQPPGNRPAPHEGLDFCFFFNHSREQIPFEAPSLVPVMYPGRVEIIFDDFLGKSILVGHDIYDHLNRRLHSVYAHLIPAPGLTNGKKVRESEILAGIAPVKSKKIPAHLHLSTIWIPEDTPSEKINWGEINNRTVGELCDPGRFLADHSAGQG